MAYIGQQAGSCISNCVVTKNGETSFCTRKDMFDREGGTTITDCVGERWIPNQIPLMVERRANLMPLSPGQAQHCSEVGLAVVP